MGEKTFINNSSHSLFEILTVRQGGQPGHLFSVNSSSIGPDGTLVVQFSGGH
jgi:hypothetical protein